MDELKVKIEYLITTQEKLVEKQEEMSDTLIRQEENLKEHMRRSQLNEESIELLRNDVRPIERHVLLVNFTVKVVTSILGSSLLVFILGYFLSK